MVGMTSVSRERQPGHWRSTYSTIVTGAFGDPSTRPCWGIPTNSRWTASAAGRAFVSEPTDCTVAAEDELLPPTASAIPTAAPATRSTPEGGGDEHLRRGAAALALSGDGQRRRLLAPSSSLLAAHALNVARGAKVAISRSPKRSANAVSASVGIVM
jgi:hypothetical protein